MALTAGLLVGCDSPTQPDPRVAPAIGSPTRLAVMQWRFGSQITSIRIQATWGSLYSSQREVTSDATWHSSDTAVVRIPRAGQVESAASGSATLTITYRDVSITEELRVFPGESPLPLLTTSNTTYVADAIRDATRPTDRGVEGVLVEILSGHNAGRSATTDANGWYYFYPPFVCGPVTARASKPGYRTRVGSSVMCENGMPDLTLTPVP